MSSLAFRFSTHRSDNVSAQLLRDLASLILTGELVGSSLVALRPECRYSAEMTAMVDSLVRLCDSGEALLQPALLESGLVLPTTSDPSASTLVTGFFRRLPFASDRNAFANEVTINLQLLAQHVELKARLAAEEARIVGLTSLCEALESLTTDWRECRKTIAATLRQGRSRQPADRTDVVAFALPSGI